MAIISGSIMALKLIASQGLKKAAVQTAKGAVKGAVKNKAKNFVTGKGKKGKKGKGGALVKSEGGQEEGSEGGGGAIVPTTPMVGSYKVETVSDKPEEVGKPSKVSYESINNQLDSIIGLTNVLKKTSAAKLKTAENRRKAERKAAEKAKKRSRESMLESAGGAALGLAGNLYGKATKGFDPLKFFTMIFLGNLVKWFNENGSKISAPLRIMLAAMNNALKVIKAGLKALGGAFKGGFKLIGKLPRVILGIGKSIGKTLLNVGKRLGKAFLRVGKGLFKFIRGLLGKLRIPGLPRLPFRGPTPKGKTPPKPPKGPTPKGPTPKGGPQIKSTPRIDNKLKNMGLADNQVDVYNKARQSGAPATAALKQAKATPPKAPKAPKTLTSVNKFLKKIFGITNPKDIKKLKDASPVLKKGGNFLKGARIPVVGPMIVFALTALDPNPETGGIGRAAFKAIGTGLGEFLGFAIPIPVLGPIIGGLVGEVMGDVAYEIIVNNNPKAAGKKIMDAVTATGEFFGPILEWGKGVVTRFFDAIPKVKIPELPDWAKRIDFAGLLQSIPIWGQEIIDPKMFTAAALLELPQMFMKAFFGTSDEKGKVKKVKDLTGQSKQISEGDYYHQPGVGYFRVGGAGEYLGATEEEARAKLGSSSTTNINPNVSASSPEGYVSSLMPQSKASAFYKAMGINEQMWKTYKDTIASIETSGYSLADSYKAIGGSGDAYDGRYQMGRLARMDAAQALGIPTPSREELRNNAQLQEDMFLAYTYKNYTYMSGASAQFDSASNVQKLQYLGYAHNQGHAFATDWLKTGVISSVDGFGTKGTKFTDKLAKTLKPYLDGTKPQVSKTDSEGKPVIKPQNTNPSESLETPETATPAQVSPSTQSQSQMSNGITGLSQQLSYEQTGNTVVIMQASNNQQLPMGSGNGGKGTPIIMGSGDVVNSYYKSQILGFLYKQG